MLAELLTIGDELLIGQVIDTNSSWMAEKLNLEGIEVKRITSISDNREEIVQALDEALARSSIILITGGPGPTKDDLTKISLCSYFKTESFIAIRNKNGTAPGMWFENEGKVIVSMPGVPYEMKAMMENEVLPSFRKRFRLPAIYHKTILTQGIGESFLSDLIGNWENSLRQKHIKLAYLPAAGKVRLRLSAYGPHKEELIRVVEEEILKVKPLIEHYIYGYENYGEKEPALERIVGEMLKEKHATLATAESCTGGYISHLLTSAPGSSAYYLGSIISYANAVKVHELNVDPGTIEKNGVVSREVAEQMACGARAKLAADYVISASGIAGPEGGTPEKPIGTVWIAVAGPEGIVSQKFLFGNNRGRNIERTAISALNMLREYLLSAPDKKY